MKAEIAFGPLLAAAQALKPYTTPQRWHTRTRLLYLHADGDTLTLSATTGEQTATVPLPGAVCDGFTALAPDTLIKALTAINGQPPTVAAQPAPHERPVTAGPVADWCDLLAGVTTAAGREPTRPDLAVVRLLRDHPHVVLLAEATSGYRIHRGSWGDPHGDPVDVQMPADAAERAVRLLHTLDPAGRVRVHTDDRNLMWRTDRVRLAAATGGPAFPNLEKIREDLLDDATITITVPRADLLAAVRTAHQLTATTRQPRLRLKPGPAGVLHLVLRTDTGAPMYTTPVAINQLAAPAPTLTLNPGFARDALAFLDGDTVEIHASADRLPIYLRGQRRHAIVMQIAP